MLCSVEHKERGTCADEGYGDSFCGTAETGSQQKEKYPASGTLVAVFIAEDDHGREEAAGDGR